MAHAPNFWHDYRLIIFLGLVPIRAGNDFCHKLILEISESWAHASSRNEADDQVGGIICNLQ